MKNVKTILFGLAVLSMAACTQEKLETPNGDQELVEVTIEAGIDNGVDSKVVFNDTGRALEMNWKDRGEAFSMLVGNDGFTNVMSQTDKLSDGTAVFTGKLPEVTDDNAKYSVYAVYPALPEGGKLSATSAATEIDMSSQTGEYDESKTYMFYKVASQAYSTWMENPKGFNFKPVISILKVVLNFEGITTGTAIDMIFEADDLLNKGNINYNSNSWPSQYLKNGPINITESVDIVDGKATVYVYMIPGTVTNLSVKATVDHREFSAVVKEGARTIAAGKQYNTSATMTSDVAAITSLTILHEAEGYSYDGLTAQVGKAGSSSVLATGTFAEGRATLSEGHSLAADDEIWICIPKVAKFFHTLTADELSDNVINLPDKDAGSTLKSEPLLDGKPYVNDWIVTLYMGVDAFGTPVYWATGNLVAVKTTPAGTASAPAFYIATAEETAAEGKSPNPYNVVDNTKRDKTDGYVNCAQGFRWDMFMATDPTGTVTDNSDVSLSKLTEQGLSGGSYSASVLDIATTQLGAGWQLPDRWGQEAGNGMLSDLIVNSADNARVFTLSTIIDGATYTKIKYTSGAITNTLLIPYAGDKRSANPITISKNYARILAGNLHITSGNPIVYSNYSNGTQWNYGSNIMNAVRPITK